MDIERDKLKLLIYQLKKKINLLLKENSLQKKRIYELEHLLEKTSQETQKYKNLSARMEFQKKKQKQKQLLLKHEVKDPKKVVEGIKRQKVTASIQELNCDVSRTQKSSMSSENSLTYKQVGKKNHSHSSTEQQKTSASIQNRSYNRIV